MDHHRLGTGCARVPPAVGPTWEWNPHTRLPSTLLCLVVLHKRSPQRSGWDLESRRRRGRFRSRDRAGTRDMFVSLRGPPTTLVDAPHHQVPCLPPVTSVTDGSSQEFTQVRSSPDVAVRVPWTVGSATMVTDHEGDSRTLPLPLSVNGDGDRGHLNQNKFRFTVGQSLSWPRGQRGPEPPSVAHKPNFDPPFVTDVTPDPPPTSADTPAAD